MSLKKAAKQVPELRVIQQAQPIKKQMLQKVEQLGQFENSEQKISKNNSPQNRQSKSKTLLMKANLQVQMRQMKQMQDSLQEYEKQEGRRKQVIQQKQQAYNNLRVNNQRLTQKLFFCEKQLIKGNQEQVKNTKTIQQQKKQIKSLMADKARFILQNSKLNQNLIKTNQKQANAVKEVQDMKIERNNLLKNIQQLTKQFKQERKQIAADLGVQNLVLGYLRDCNDKNPGEESIKNKLKQFQNKMKSKYLQKPFINLINAIFAEFLDKKKEARQHRNVIQNVIKAKQQAYSAQMDILLKQDINSKIKVSVQQKELQNTCKICYAQPLQMIHSECNHLLYCQKCAKTAKPECCICKKVGVYKKIFKV